jgi:hypothetical protein
MSVAHGTRALIGIEAQESGHAGGLVQALVRVFDADEVALDGESLMVEIRPWGDPDAAVVRALEVVDSWLAAEGLDATMVHILDRSYRISSDGVRGS